MAFFTLSLKLFKPIRATFKRIPKLSFTLRVLWFVKQDKKSRQHHHFFSYASEHNLLAYLTRFSCYWSLWRRSRGRNATTSYWLSLAVIVDRRLTTAMRVASSPRVGTSDSRGRIVSTEAVSSEQTNVRWLWSDIHWCSIRTYGCSKTRTL